MKKAIVSVKAMMIEMMMCMCAMCMAFHTFDSDMFSETMCGIA